MYEMCCESLKLFKLCVLCKNTIFNESEIIKIPIRDKTYYSHKSCYNVYFKKYINIT